jgi:hypothetical protein
MKDNQPSKSELESEELVFGTGAISENPETNVIRQKRKTIKIKLPPKPYAPRSSAVVIRYLKLQRQ